MKILTLADVPCKALWDYFDQSRIDDIDLILSAGDLPAAYLSFLVTFAHCPVLYVRGNHDDRYEKQPPEGCACVEDTIYTWNGIRILGLGGSMRYRPGINQYTDAQMARRIRALRLKLMWNRGFDILLTHAPGRGINDQEDLCHMGFICFRSLVEKHRPAVMIHGHVHQSYTAFFKHEREYNGIPVINAYMSYVFELPDTPDRREPTSLGRRMLRRASELK